MLGIRFRRCLRRNTSEADDIDINHGCRHDLANPNLALRWQDAVHIEDVLCRTVIINDAAPPSVKVSQLIPFVSYFYSTEEWGLHWDFGINELHPEVFILEDLSA